MLYILSNYYDVLIYIMIGIIIVNFENGNGNWLNMCVGYNLGGLFLGRGMMGFFCIMISVDVSFDIVLIGNV